MTNWKITLIKTAVIIGLVLVCAPSFSQKKKKKSKTVKISMNLLEAGGIRENHNLRGYYQYFTVDKAFGKYQNYLIELYDENTNKLNEIKLKEKIDYKLLNCAYSNEEICFMFLDNENRKYEYKVYNMDSKLVSEFQSSLTKKEYKKVLKFGAAAELISLKEGGFVSTSTISEKNKLFFKLTKFKKGSEKKETYEYRGNRKFNQPFILGVSNGIIVVSVITSKTRQGKVVYKLIGVNSENMRQSFIKSSDMDGENIFIPYSLTENPGYNTIKLSGVFYEPKGRLKRGSKGLGMWELDKSGTLLKERYSAWDKNYKSFLDFNKKGKAKKFGYVGVQRMFSTADGKMYAVGEGYRKKFNPGGLISILFSYPMFLTKYQTTDLALFEFDKNFNFVSGRKLPKQLKSYVGFGFSTLNVHRIARYMPMFGYQFTQLDEEKNSFMIAYRNDSKKRFISFSNRGGLKTLKYEDGKYTTDEFKPNKSSFSLYLQNQFGKVALLEYDRKLEKSEFRIIKVK